MGEVSSRLLSPSPLSARGVATVSWLLGDGTGPLYDGRLPGSQLRAVLTRVVAELAPDGDVGGRAARAGAGTEATAAGE
jgi:hypothetical protein